jgi:hypothetical protein
VRQYSHRQNTSSLGKGRETLARVEVAWLPVYSSLLKGWETCLNLLLASPKALLFQGKGWGCSMAL